MLTQTQQVDLTLHHLKERALAEYSPKQRATVEASEDWKQFDRRLNEHFPKLMHELDNVYNNNEAVLPMPLTASNFCTALLEVPAACH